jgi:hypothetical protein
MFSALRKISFVFLVSVWSAGHAAPADGPYAQLTILQGEATAIRETSRLALVEGTALLADDIVETPARPGLARIEFADGVSLAIGPGGRVLLAPRLKGGRGGARAYVLAGWAKLEVPKGVEASLLTPRLDFSTDPSARGVAVLAVLGERTQLFAESGRLAMRRPGSPPQSIAGGEMFSVSTIAGSAPEALKRPDQAFVQAMPRAFMDPMPLRAARFAGKDIKARDLGTVGYADAQPWIDAEPALRRENMARWRPLARDTSFRRELIAGVKSHPEWRLLLATPVAAATTGSKKPAH